MRVDGSRYRLTGAEIRLNGTRFEGEFSVERVDVEKGRARVVLEGRLAAPLVSCEQLSESAPRALLGPVADLRYAGTFSLDARVRADTSELSKMEVGVDFRNGCKITQTPVELDPMQFKGPFSREVLGVGGLPMQVRLGPGSDNWVSMEDISPLMEAALLVTEDGRFYRHEGFDVRAIESAIRDNTRAGRFVRGASTISMQLAKNLFLSREKTLSRKFQEAALTMLLEQTFEKRELLELYLNVIEFGPGIYGIGPAAAHYFGTVPADLSAAQAFFLASILPAPGISYFDEQGQLSAARKKQVRYLLGVSHERGRLTDEQLEAALAEELQFGVPAAQSEGEVQDRGVHAIPSEEGQPLAFPSDAASGGRRRAGARERDPGRVSPQLASPRQRPEKRRPSREKGVGDSAP
jgi:monofunctional biosynthetic peptidoglycan transglycosylase